MSILQRILTAPFRKGTSESQADKDAKKQEKEQRKLQTKREEDEKYRSYIYTVKNGKVHVLTRTGCNVRAAITPSRGGRATAVDYNPNRRELVITTEQGWIVMYYPHPSSFTGGCSAPPFLVKDVMMARWQGDDLLITLKNGQSNIYSRYGSVIKWL